MTDSPVVRVQTNKKGQTVTTIPYLIFKQLKLDAVCKTLGIRREGDFEVGRND